MIFADATTAATIAPPPAPPAAPQSDPTVILALVGTIGGLSTLVGWLVRQGRAEANRARDEASRARADVVTLIAAAAAEREAEAARRVQQQTDQNKVMGLMSSKLAKIATALHELTVAHHENNERFDDVSTRLRQLEDRTDEHRPLPPTRDPR